MTRRAPTRRRGLNLREPSVAARLDATGIPPGLASSLSALDVGVGVVERLNATNLGWEYVEALTHTRALSTGADVAALVTFANQGLTPTQITEWAQLGELDAGLRLFFKNVSIDTLRAFPMTADHGLQAFLKMLGAVANTGIHVDDLLWWHTAGVVSLSPPHLDDGLWTTWRSVAVNHLGLRPAALAAAAGLSVTEAVEQWQRGEFDHEALLMMAGLRAGTL